MEDYKKMCEELIEEHIKEVQTWGNGHPADVTKKRKQILEDLQENGNDNIFGNMDGSRTCNTWEAQQFIDKSGAMWDEDILNLFEDIGEDYFTDCLKRGAETLDVVILELLSHQVIGEMLEAVEVSND